MHGDITVSSEKLLTVNAIILTIAIGVLYYLLSSQYAMYSVS